MEFCKRVFHWKGVTAVATVLLLNICFQVCFLRNKSAELISSDVVVLSANEKRSSVAHKNAVKATVASIDGPLPYVLLGTAFMGTKSVACIRDKYTGSQSVYRPRDHLGNYVIMNITSGKVLLECDGVARQLLFAGKTPRNADTDSEAYESPVETKKMTISRSKAIGQLLNLNELLTRLRIIPLPDTSTNTLKGFRIDNVPEGSMVEAAGIKDGDVILAVQGMQLQSVQDAWKILGRMHGESRLEVVLLRNNQPISLHYEIKN